MTLTINNYFKKFSFEEPYWFFLTLLIPLLIWIHIRFIRSRMPTMMINGDVQLFTSKSQTLSPVDWLFALKLLGLLFLIAALAHPQQTTVKLIKSSQSVSDIVFVLDASKSMLIEDIKPNRMEALKDVLNKFIAVRSNDRMGIVLYAGESIRWCPLTTDHPQLLQQISTMHDNGLSDGTAIGAGLVTGINMLKKSTYKNKTIILISDGENNAGITDPLLAAEIARKLGIKIYCIGIGKNGVAQMPLYDFDGNKFYQKIAVTLNEKALKHIAAVTSGKYYKAENETALSSVYLEIDKAQGQKKEKSIRKVLKVPRYDWYVTIAIAVLLIQAFLKQTILRTWPE